jgi:hypothetical protein
MLMATLESAAAAVAGAAVSLLLQPMHKPGAQRVVNHTVKTRSSQTCWQNAG